MNWETKAGRSILRLLNISGLHGIRKVFLVGVNFRNFSENSGFPVFQDAGELAEFLKKEPLKGETILIKGSRGMGLEKIYRLL